VAQIIKEYKIDTEIIVASIRNQIHILECGKAGVGITTTLY